MNLSGCMHTVKNITRQCILWKTYLPGAEIFTPMCSTLWVRPFSESCQTSMTPFESKNHFHSLPARSPEITDV